MTALDWLLGRRACLLSLGFGAVLALIVVSTDEQSTSWSTRLGRFTSMLAVAGAAGAFLAAEQARSRGELRALASIGVTPLRAALGPALGGAVIAVAGALVASSPFVDLSPLFPRMDASGSMDHPLGPDAVLETTLGVLIHSSGVLENARWSLTSSTAAPVWRLPRLCACTALLVVGLSAPYWAALPCRWVHRTVIGLAVVVACIVVFHLVGAGRAPGWTLPLAPFGLVADAVALGYRKRR